MFEAIDNLTDKGITTHKFTLMGDMEIVHFNKFLKNKNITIKTCQFHFNQTICKYAKKIKCCKELVEDLMVLAISPIERVCSLFRNIVLRYIDTKSEYVEGNTIMLHYFFNNYILGKESRIENWNVSEEVHRTNNMCESLNKCLNNYFKSCEPLVFTKKLDLKTFYSIIISFIEYKNILINSGEKNQQICSM